MYHSVDGNLILQLENTRDVQKKATPVDKQKQTIEKDLGLPSVLGLVDKECHSINWNVFGDLKQSVKSIKNEYIR